MKCLDTLRALTAGGAEVPLSDLPYAAHLQLHARITDAGALLVRMQYHPELVGTPIPPRLHGGAVGGMLEVTSALTVGLQRGPVSDGVAAYPRPLNITIDYLREGAVHDVFAEATIMRLGRTIANVRAEAWQESRDRLIATAYMNLLLA
jgi:acyl-coenzyme A thioesterase PaaI-like protein